MQDKVQNAPSLGLVPQENVVSDFVLAELEPYTTKHGGFVSVERVEFIPNRGNVIIKYLHPDFADSQKTLAFVGSHLDVVPANPEGWARDPFTLSVEGDKLYGRGTTDCLGHVALMTRACFVPLCLYDGTWPELTVLYMYCRALYPAGEEQGAHQDAGRRGADRLGGER